MRHSTILSALGKALALALVLLWSLLPIALIVTSSFKLDRDIFSVPNSVAFTPTLANYVALWQRWGDFFTGLLNSLIVTVGATVLSVGGSMLAGYAYSRYRGRALSFSAFFLIFIRLIPPIIITLPLFPAVNGLRLNDTHFVLIVLYATFFVSLGTLVMRTFIDQIRRSSTRPP
jgi:multiple sugar transport system permease protein